MPIRHATAADLEALTALEALCFPAAEAADRTSLARRLAAYPEHFWLLEEHGTLISFVNGMVTNEPNLTDLMYEDASLHNPAGQWQMIFGVDTHPAWRCRGYAAQTLCAAIEDTRAAGRAGLVLTCKNHLRPYYAKFGFVEEGISDSTHGGVQWHQMRLRFAL